MISSSRSRARHRRRRSRSCHALPPNAVSWSAPLATIDRVRPDLAIAMCAALASSACSAMCVVGPPPPRLAPYDCTESRVAPVLDTIGAIDAVMMAGMIEPIAEDAATAWLIIGTIYGVSAYGGYGRTRRCRAARAEQRQE